MEIELTQGKTALIDDNDIELVNKYKWCAYKGRNTFYAVTGIPTVKGRTTLQMHRLILDLKPGDKKHTDHINHDGLDNRRNNLRICSCGENIRNQQKRKTYSKKTTSSNYKGVSWYKRHKKWHAYIRFNKKLIYLGLYDTELEAAVAYDKKATELFGDYAELNFEPNTWTKIA